ncbi:anthranilate synthase component I family protein [Filimonas effusa]|uniref:anthranilate synthase component I family protein n=1 Tax=Filimonas effusa TaxID=2508721 RepID=UPI001FE5FDA1|nr:anthranilate synthase component I family protein [Filimonas effusa]
MDNNQYAQPHHSYESLLAVGPVSAFAPSPEIINDGAALLNALQQYTEQHQDWLFGHFNYNFAGSVTGALSPATTSAQRHDFPVCYLFQPDIVIQLEASHATISCLQSNPADVYASICATHMSNTPAPTKSGITMQPRFTREEYLQTIQQLQQHILRGDCYELNFCQEFFATDVTINPELLYQKLTSLSPTPFAAYYKLGSQYALCASPERYIRKTGSQLISQPIKGTSARIPHDTAADEQSRQNLLHSAKDKSENVMVVDLVRNDLSKVCEEGSVHVPELFGIYSFPQVHQMISTIEGRLLPGLHLREVLEASFPMGSMTGAPKKRVMELIAQYERSERGLYSGSIGYIKPGGDFDFNVVIRSLFYNTITRYLSYQVGGGITFYSEASREYEECLLKAKAIEKAIQ